MPEGLWDMLYTAADMRAAEEAYPGYPDTVPELMERAGAAVAREAMRAFPDAKRFAAVCGKGSNGGDGRVAVRVLREAGREAEETTDVDGADVVIDALFGTGFRGAPRPEAAELIERMNATRLFRDSQIVAVDIPSGVDSSTGEAPGAAVEATLTVTFHAPKVGLHVAPGRFHAGEVVVADIGLESRITQYRRVLPGMLRVAVLPKAPEDTKYSAGSVLVVGGAPGLTGAVCLAAEAAFRADAGYVAVAVPEASRPVVETRLLEAVKRTWGELNEAAERADAVAVGPGLGRTEEARALVHEVLALDLPVVLDADALYELEPFERDAPTVLTPHAGELARLLGENSDWVDAHRLEALQRAVERFRCTVLLKGADTLVASPGEAVLVVDLGTPALATAGTGDVLTGIVAAFLAKLGEPADYAAAAAAAAQQLAATLLPYQRGATAGDIISVLPAALASVQPD